MWHERLQSPCIATIISMLSLSDPIVGKLLTFLKARPRADRRSDHTYIDTGNNLELIHLPRHAAVFGRRGSGKTMLLKELERSGRRIGEGVIWIDIDDYKTLTFPDILIQVLRSIVKGLIADVRSKSWPRPWTWWNARAIIGRLRKEEEYLSKLLQRFDEGDAQREESFVRSNSQERTSLLTAKAVIAPSVQDVRKRDATTTNREAVSGRVKKIDDIRRHLHDAKSLIADARLVAHGQYFVVLDDFYHLRVEDQAQVLDYLQSLFKNANVFMKFGTIAHRSSLYRRGEVTIEGMQKEHDVLPIDLDRTFQNFTEVEEFLKKLWGQIKSAVDQSANLDEIFGGGSGWQQLVLASGGVPRDFVNILARSLELGRGRSKERLDVFLINEAANLYLRETKHEDLVSDKHDETEEIERLLIDLRNFCTDQKKRNLFLVNKDELESKSHQQELLRQLTDFRFIHLVHSNTSAASEKGRYEAYMLDVGLYAHPQRRGDNRVEQVNFLTRDDQHRNDTIRTQPIYQLREHYDVGDESPFDAPQIDDGSPHAVEQDDSDKNHHPTQRLFDEFNQ